jgi:parallel beta-helix repeat protein
VRIVAAAAQSVAQGTRVTGNTLQSNLAGGVVVDGGGAHTIGGTTAGSGNTITANGVAGVVLQMAPGTSKLPGVTVGQNTISANAGSGILVGGGGGHSLTANRIIGNAGDGISLGMTVANVISGNTIGGATTADANVNGILLADGSASNRLSGNTITANAADGIRITGLRATDNVIGIPAVGTPTTGVANTVTGNTGAAVRIQQGVRNQVGTNAFFANLGGGVVLQNGGNSSQPAPVLTAASRIVTGGLVQLQVSGTLTGAPRQVMVVEFFANNAADGSTSARTGYQARTSIGRATITLDAAGRATFTTTLTANVAVGQYITAIATPASGVIGNSSQISTLAVRVTAGVGSPVTPPTPTPPLPRSGVFTKW